MSASNLHIAIAGAAGRMGRMLALAALEGSGVVVASGTERGDAGFLDDAGSAGSSSAFRFPVFADPVAAAEKAQVWIDFTTPTACISALEALAAIPEASPLRAVVIGTTGFSPEEEARIAALARRFAIVKSGNFSLGINMIVGLIEQAASALGPDWDIEITEAHHRRKIDAPSGTALMIAEAAARGRGAKLADLLQAPHHGPDAPRQAGGIGLAVTRGGGVVGDHTLNLMSESEVVTIAHRALDRAVFARGALHAARWVAEQPPGLYNMRDVLGLS